jgi:hypothetical protein
MRDDHDRAPGLLVERAQRIEDPLLAQRIELAGRLVGGDERRSALGARGRWRWRWRWRRASAREA